MYFLYFLLSCIGLSHIIVESFIMQDFKLWLEKKNYSKLLYLTKCYQCSGFWCGFILGIYFNPISVYDFLSFFFMLICYGFIGSFISPLGAALINYLDIYRGGK